MTTRVKLYKLRTLSGRFVYETDRKLDNKHVSCRALPIKHLRYIVDETDVKFFKLFDVSQHTFLYSYDNLGICSQRSLYSSQGECKRLLSASLFNTT